MKKLFLVCFLFLNLLAIAHEEHENKISKPDSIREELNDEIQQVKPSTWTQWIGSFHLILLHFPIALINLLVVSELLLTWHKKPIFEFASKFLIVSAAILTPPTAVLGIIYSYSTLYTGLMETFLWWHMTFGILTAIVSVIIIFARERSGRNILYFSCLVLLFLMVNITGFFGGGMTFGPYLMIPPF